jgi:Tol biopolymer transport system component
MLTPRPWKMRQFAVIFGSLLAIATGACDGDDDGIVTFDATPTIDALVPDARPDAGPDATPADAAPDASGDAAPPDATPPDADLFVDAQPAPDAGPESAVDRAVVARASSLGLAAIGVDGTFPATFDTHDAYVTDYAIAPAPVRLVAFTLSPDAPSHQHDETNEALAVGSVDTGASWQVSLPAQPGAIIRSFAWSADGEWLAYTRAESLAGHDSLYVVRADGTHHRRLLTDTVLPPRWSPTAHRLVIGHRLPGDGGSELLLACVESECTRSLSEGKPIIQNGVWSPDGTLVAFPGDLDLTGHYDAYVAAADGEELLRLSHLSGQAGAGYFTWSPDGQKVAFYALSGSFGAVWDPYVACADASCLRLLRPASVSAGVAYEELWSNDSQKVLLTFQPHDTGEFHLYLTCADGSCLDRLDRPEREPLRSFGTLWAPQNDWIAYVVDMGEDFALVASRPDGSDEHVLATDSQQLPTFDHAGHKLVYFQGLPNFQDADLWLRPSVEGAPVKLDTLFHDYELKVTWDSSDRFIVLSHYGAHVYCADGSCVRDLGESFGPNGLDAQALQLVPAAR